MASLPSPVCEWVVMNPDGKFIRVTKEFYESLQDFMELKRSGSVVISFRNGGIAGIRGEFEKVYK